jgi:hypothetical protein
MPDRPWSPTRFVRFEESIGTSTGPARIITDAGPAFLKAVNNPIGPHALVRDFLGTGLAAWLGLDTFEIALMQVRPGDEIPLSRGGMASAGTAFLARRADGYTWGGSDAELDRIENADAISRLVVFDTWTLNADRYPPPSSPRKPNPDNVFLSGEKASVGHFRLLAFDHTECFGGSSRDLSVRVADIRNIKNVEVFGLFRAFAPRVSANDLRASVGRLSEFKRSVISDLVAQVPWDWQLEPAVGDALCELATQRAAFVAENIERAISEATGKLTL